MQCAEAGGGTFRLINTSEQDISEKLMSVFRQSVSPCLSNFQLTYDRTVIKAISPKLDSNSKIVRGEVVRLFAVIDKTRAVESTEVIVEYTHSKHAERRRTVFKIDLKKPMIASNYAGELFDVYS